MNVRPVAHESAKKPVPDARAAKCAPLRLVYTPSTSGVDSSLIVFLHGLGDSEGPLASLGKRLQFAGLPAQTATLSVGGGAAIPFLNDDGAPPTAWAFWDVWDEHGEQVLQPDPRMFLTAFQRLVAYLTRDQHAGGCGWPASAIHLFGFAHGATAALEGVIAYTRGESRTTTAKIVELTSERDEEQRTTADTSYASELGSVVSVCGDLLSHPTFTPPLNVPVLLFERSSKASSSSSIKRAFANTQTVQFPVHGAVDEDAAVAMPRNDAEWRAIMAFWARVLRTRSAWELDNTDDQPLYVVSSSSSTAPATQSQSKLSTSTSNVVLEDIGWSPTAEEKRGHGPAMR